MLHSRTVRSLSGRAQQRASSAGRPSAPVSRTTTSVAHTRRVCVRVSSAAPAAGGAASAAQLQQALAMKESELASLFQSGRAMPAAGVVAALRAEIAALEDQLHGRPVAQPYVPSAPTPSANGAPAGMRGRGPSVPALNSSFPPPAAYSSAAPPAMRPSTEELANKAYDMVQQQLNGTPGSPAARPPPAAAPPARSPAAAGTTPGTWQTTGDPAAAAAAAFYSSPAANATYDAMYGGTPGPSSSSQAPVYTSAAVAPQTRPGGASFPAPPPAPAGGYSAAPSAYAAPNAYAAAPMFVPGSDAEIAQLEAQNAALRAEAFNLLQRQQKLETMLEEVEGSKPPELLLETTEQMLARMKAKLQRA